MEKIKLRLGLVLLSVVFAAALVVGGCGKTNLPPETVAEEADIDPAQVIADIEEDQVDLSNLGLPWPTDVPAEVPVLEGATITYVQEAPGARTIMFEGLDKGAMLAYVENLTASGFIQGSFAENDFGLDYTGGKGSIRIFINFVPTDISKLDIRY